MAKQRRTTRYSADTPKEDPHAPPAVSENDLNDALTNALENNAEDDVEDDAEDDAEDDYRPDAEQDAMDEDVSLNNDEDAKADKTEQNENEENENEENEDDENEDDENDEDNMNSDGNTSSTSLKRKLAAAARRHKHSNLNAVNRKRQQLTPVAADEGQEEDSSPVENDEFITADDPKECTPSPPT
ncbi:hypothetical protein PMKS-002606 [Pichia membranifaciens]|uniref:Uncharacterized protein n=1 Tax=Pichia membranifaciens TaxID=4926 RepID=A0A1Q2YHU6_9ASCO|nr:hypothetical protein PMKS-002606 [Pichia membranifaciens]